MTLEQKPAAETAEEWRCFFCGETFTDIACATQHFGGDLSSLAGCQIKAEEGGLLNALRKVEDQLARYRVEDSDTDRAMYAMQANHRQALIREEEAGYNKGMSDMREQDAQQRSAVAALAEALRNMVEQYVPLDQWTQQCDVEARKALSDFRAEIEEAGK